MLTNQIPSVIIGNVGIELHDIRADLFKKKFQNRAASCAIQARNAHYASLRSASALDF